MPAVAPTPSIPIGGGRSAWVAGALVGAVVLVLGFGSGLGQVTSRRRISYRASGPLTPGSATPGPGGVDVAVAPAAGGHAFAPASDPHEHGTGFGGTGANLAGVGSTAAPSTTVTPAPAARTPVTAAAPPGACPTQTVASAMLAPLVAHLDKAHLETSVGQQVADLLNLDQYVKTHTVLLESILSPLLDVVLALPDGLLPLMTHLDKAHLETSVGQQAADLLSVDQYVKTHTVLAEAILAPGLNAAMGVGC